jgi:DNA-3-methyladenine glycosylase II
VRLSIGDKKLHSHFVKVSGEIPETLPKDIRAIDPIEFPDRTFNNLANFLARTVAGQPLFTKAAQTIRERIEAARKDTGERSPEFLREENESLIKNCGLSGSKTKTLGHIWDAHLAGLLSSVKLKALLHTEHTARLSSIWGIGPWTCDMASIFYFKDEDIWFEGDMSAQNTFQRHISRRKPSLALHRAYLAFRMWRILDGGG